MKAIAAVLAASSLLAASARAQVLRVDLAGEHSRWTGEIGGAAGVYDPDAAARLIPAVGVIEVLGGALTVREVWKLVKGSAVMQTPTPAASPLPRGLDWRDIRWSASGGEKWRLSSMNQRVQRVDMAFSILREHGSPVAGKGKGKFLRGVKIEIERRDPKPKTAMGVRFSMECKVSDVHNAGTPADPVDKIRLTIDGEDLPLVGRRPIATWHHVVDVMGDGRLVVVESKTTGQGASLAKVADIADSTLGR
ncbi:MAG: hypothetical protein HY078_06620 [Elusimicrobia bacterium]|nr:hypothetical protein [Elusimicrobiota bacterium]